MARTNNEIQEDLQKCKDCQERWLRIHGDIYGLYEKCATCPTGVRANKDDSLEVRKAANKLRGWI